MGRKRTWSGQYIYLCVALVTCIGTAGCTSIRGPVPEADSGQLRCVEIRRLQIGPSDSSTVRDDPCQHLAQGRKLLSQGDYAAALRENEKALTLSGLMPPGDEALFNMGLIYANPENPGRDYGKSMEYMRRVMREHPRGFWAEQAGIWEATVQDKENTSRKLAEIVREDEKVKRALAEALQENARLKQVIDQSKQVDVETEEKKRLKGR
jgi:hypothetical protein